MRRVSPQVRLRCKGFGEPPRFGATLGAMSLGLSELRGCALARIALGHVTNEYPNKPDHVLGGDADLHGPRTLHPIFYGSFDWHSCVHGYWLLTHLYRLFPSVAEAERIRALVDAHFTTHNVAGELAYLSRPSSKTFERPYGCESQAPRAPEGRAALTPRRDGSGERSPPRERRSAAGSRSDPFRDAPRGDRFRAPRSRGPGC